jgi:predicted nucleic acid-binding protein
MTLADTSIWIEMFRRGRFKAEMESLIAKDQLCIHPFIVAELACGSIPDRRRTLHDLDVLFALPTISTADIRLMIEARGLSSKGIGFIDAQLIGSCLATPGTQIWTVDGPLSRVAESLGIRATIR